MTTVRDGEKWVAETWDEGARTRKDGGAAERLTRRRQGDKAREEEAEGLFRLDDDGGSRRRDEDGALQDV